MKKFLAIVLALMMLLCMTACGSQSEVTADAPSEADENGRTVATEYTFTASGEDQAVCDLIFEEDVTIEGEAGNINFQNCVFEKNIINNGTGAVVARFMPETEFDASSKCIISSGIEDATIETNLPKFMFFCAPVATEIEDAGAVVAFAEYPVTMNGEEYSIENSDNFYDEATGEMSAYSGQEATMHNCATWIESGTVTTMQVAIMVDLG